MVLYGDQTNDVDGTCLALLRQWLLVVLQVRAFQRTLQTVSDDELPIERRSEAEFVREFLQSRIDGGSGGSLFVAGKPGTGGARHWIQLSSSPARA